MGGTSAAMTQECAELVQSRSRATGKAHRIRDRSAAPADGIVLDGGRRRAPT